MVSEKVNCRKPGQVTFDGNVYTKGAIGAIHGEKQRTQSE